MFQKCEKIDRDISDAQNDKMELENKLTYLKDKFFDVQQNTNNLTKTIEDIRALKLKVCLLLVN